MDMPTYPTRFLQFAGAWLISNVSAGLSISGGKTARANPMVAEFQPWSDQYECIESGLGRPLQLVLSRGLDKIIGTGAEVHVPRIVVDVKSHVPYSAATSPSLLTPADIVAAIRSSLCLQVKELAEIVGVERPTIYSWIRGESEPQRANWDALRRVHAVAEEWKRIANVPMGRMVRAIGNDGHSLVEILRSQEFTLSDVRKRLADLGKAPVRGNRRSMREVLESRGVDVEALPTNDDVIDVVTGRPIYEE